MEYNNNRFDIDLICSDILEIPEEYNEQFDHVVGFLRSIIFCSWKPTFRRYIVFLNPEGRCALLNQTPTIHCTISKLPFTPGMSWKGDKGVAMMHQNRFVKAAKYAGLSSLKLDKYGFLPPFAANTTIGKKGESMLEKIKLLKGVSAFQAVTLKKPHHGNRMY